MLAGTMLAARMRLPAVGACFGDVLSIDAPRGKGQWDFLVRWQMEKENIQYIPSYSERNFRDDDEDRFLGVDWGFSCGRLT